MGMIKEFKEFALKGNVMDLAIAVVIGAAFGRIVTSLVNDVIMPPIGLLLGGVDFSELKVVLEEAVVENEEIITEAVTINYGAFINTIISFLIIAIVIFMIIKGMNSMQRKKEATPPPPPPMPTKEEQLLTEIRDALVKK